MIKRILLAAVLVLGLFTTFINASESVPTKEEVAKLYVATFNRAPDSAGLTYWVNKSGLTLSQIAQSFFDQPETQATYPLSTTNEAFIRSVYRNLFNREPDAAGLSYWKNELDSGQYSKNLFIQTVINGAQGDDVVILENKKEVGLAFADAGLDDVPAAKRVIEGISAAHESVMYIMQKIESGAVAEGLWDGYSVFEITSPSSVTVDENQKDVLTIEVTPNEGYQVYYSIAGEDKDAFEIDHVSGEVVFKQAPDFEKKSHYTFTAIAVRYKIDSNSEKNQKERLNREALERAEQEVTVYVNNIPENPSIALFKKAIHMDQSPGGVVGKIKILNRGDGNITSYSLDRTRDFRVVRNGIIINTTPFDFHEDTTLVFKIKVTNSAGQIARQNALVTLVKDNTPPVAFDQNVTICENSTNNPIDLNATDMEEDDLTYVYTQPEHGTLSGVAPNLTYTPNIDYFGEDKFNFLVSDGRDESNVATVTIKIKRFVSFEDFEEDNALDNWTTEGSVELSQSEPDEGLQHLLLTSHNISVSNIANAFDGVTVSELNNAAQASLTNGAYAKRLVFLQRGDELTIRYNFKYGDYHPWNDASLIIINGDVQRLAGGVDLPNYGTTGWKSYKYTAMLDGWVEFGFTVLNDSDTAVDSSLLIDNISICKIGPNNPPVAFDQNITVLVNSIDNIIELNATDVDGDSLIYIRTDPSHGSISGTEPNLTYTPNPEYAGEDSFTFYVNDGIDDSNIATVSINIKNSCINLLIDDNFDNDPVGSLPEGWNIKYNGTGTANQKVVDTVSVSPEHSFQLEGAGGWAANIYKALPSIPSRMTVEANINMERVVSAWTGWFALYNKDVDTWGTQVGGLSFYDGKFSAYYAGGNHYEINNFNPDQWYNVKIEYNIANRTYQIYIDGDLVTGIYNGEAYTTFPMHPTVDAAQLMLTAGNGGRVKVFYDDVKVYEECNIALHKQVNALTNTALGDPQNITDGDLNNLWYSFPGGTPTISFIVDLEEVYTISRYYFQTLQTRSYVIESSVDGVTWTTRHNISGLTYYTDPPQDIDVAIPYQARYLKYTAVNHDNGFVGMVEFEVYGD